MRILILLLKWKGGVGTVILNVKREIEKQGHEVDIISRNDDLGIYSIFNSVFPLRKKIRELMTNKKYDIIYTQDWSMAFPLLYPYPIYRSKHFCCFHGNQLRSASPIQMVVGKLMGKRLVVVGDSIKKRFKKSTRIYNGVDLKLFRPLNKKRTSLGWIDKPTEYLSEKELIDLAKKLDLKCAIARDIPPGEMNNFYNKCAVFISLPPKSAGFNLCWIEAMASGVPIIIGNNEGIGWKLDIDKVKSKEELFNNISQLKEKDYRKLIENSNLTWKNNVNKLLRLFKNLT